MTSLPIIFIHDGNSDYLRYSLAQAALTNPERQICLVGDDSNDCYPFCKHYPFRDYIANAVAFSERYLHLSPNDSGFELFCFVRWFILRDFMLLNKLEQAVYIDSDIMLYDNLHDDWQAAAGCDIAICGVAPPVMITNIFALDEFCRFMEESYGREEGRKALVRRYEDMQRSGIIGGICDMTLWEIMLQNRRSRVLDLSTPDGSGNVYDCNLQLSHGYVMHDGIKKITWKGGRPFGTRLDGSMVRFKGLHFHGEKKRMGTFYHDWFDSLATP